MIVFYQQPDNHIYFLECLHSLHFSGEENASVTPLNKIRLSFRESDINKPSMTRFHIIRRDDTHSEASNNSCPPFGYMLVERR